MKNWVTLHPPQDAWVTSVKSRARSDRLKGENKLKRIPTEVCTTDTLRQGSESSDGGSAGLMSPFALGQSVGVGLR